MPLRTATVTLVVTQTTVVAVVSSMPFGPGRLLRWWHLHVWLAVIHHDLGTLSQKTPRIIRTHPDFDVLSLKPSISYILFTSTSNFALSCAVSCAVLRCEAALCCAVKPDDGWMVLTTHEDVLGYFWGMALGGLTQC